MEDPVVVQPTAKLRICRMPGCLITFDPKWVVRVQDPYLSEPMDTEGLCPRCGADLDRNAFLRRSVDCEIIRDAEDSQ
jgi:hypothetical protein